MAINRGIKWVDTTVKDFIMHNNKVIKIKIDSGLLIDVDFVFDCSGFYRLTAKLYNVKWNSYSDYLTVNAAIPFFWREIKQKIHWLRQMRFQ